MAKYKKGTIELDESVVGAKTPEDWASQGFTKMADTPTPQGDNNATLTSADKAQKTIVGIGSDDANKLLSKGWTVGAKGSSVMDLPSAFDYSPTTKKDDAITSDVLKSEGEEITIPQIDKAEDTGEATIAGAQEQMKSISDYIKEATPPQGEKAEEAGTLTGEISKLLEETQGQQEMLQAEEKARGVSSIEEQIKNINNEMSIKIAQYQKLHADIQSKPISMASIIGQQAQTRAVMQADIGFLQARASALQNNLTFAQDQAEKAVDDKYTPILEELKIKQDQLNLLQPALSKEENLYATALNRQYADQQAKIEEQKETEKGVKKIALQILANTGDNALANQVENAQTVMEAMQIGGRLATEEGWEYVNTPAKRDQLIAQGYETIQAGGRTYARKGGGETVQAYVNQIKSGRIKLNSVPADIRNQVAVELGDSPISGGESGGGTTEKKVDNKKTIENNLLTEIGGDGFLSPDDYNLAKQDWIQAGYEPDDFDKKFKGRRNPNNPYYKITGKTASTDEKKIQGYIDEGYSSEEIAEAGYDKDTVNKLFNTKKEEKRSLWDKFWN